MQRVTITVDDGLLDEIDQLILARGYQNRSEAIRDLARAGLQQMSQAMPVAAHCVGALVYVYDHEVRDLPKRLTRGFHDHHDLSLASMHVHLDHESCMEVVILKGEAPQVQALAETVIAQRGVRYGQMVMVPAVVSAEEHRHDDAPELPHKHIHAK